MKNLFFVVLSFAFFLTSCTKDFVEPNISTSVKNESVLSRTSTTELTLTVSNVQIIGDDVIIEYVDFDDNNSGLIIAEYQTLNFYDNSSENSPISVTMSVTSSEIIGDDVIIEYVAPSVNFDNMTIAAEQNITFNIE